MDASSFPLLLTGTILPSKGQIAKLYDPNIRRKHYTDCLLWLAHNNPGIRTFIFCENSGAAFPEFESLQEFYTRLGLRLEFFNVRPEENQYLPGKGWGEGLTVKKALKYCPLLNHATGFYKLTGRYKIKNLRAAINCIKAAITLDKPQPEFVFQPPSRFYQDAYAETGFFWSAKDFYEDYLMDAYEDVNDRAGIYLEHVFGRRLATLASSHRIGVFPFPIILDGVSGHSGKPITSTFKRFKLHINTCFNYRSRLCYDNIFRDH
jgi:hypothetical protein